MTTALKSLLAGLIDYAGLFPPAALPMNEAVANFAAYRVSPDAHALARFVVPAIRLDEFAISVTPHLGEDSWRLSVLAQVSDVDAIRSFNTRFGGRAIIDTVETRASTVEAVSLLGPLAAVGTLFVEVPVQDDPGELIAALGAHRCFAKIRMGGVTADTIPTTAEVVRFLMACAQHDVMFKATAGLHHPVRGEYPLTPLAGAATGTMCGFLNLFLAAAFARRGMAPSEVAELLEDRDVGAMHFSGDGVEWHGHRLTTARLADARSRFALSFGSCSFREPLDDLSALGLQ